MIPLPHQYIVFLVCLVPEFGIFDIGDMVYLVKIPSATIMLKCTGVEKGIRL